MTRKLVPLTFLLTCVSMYALSFRAQQTVDDFMALRMRLTCDSGTQAILDKIDGFEKAMDTSDFTDEERLVMENFIVMERYNYIRNDDDQRKPLRAALKNLRQRNADYLDAAEKDGREADKWLLCTAADVTSCFISFSLGDVIKYGLGIKKLYQQAVSRDDNFSYGLTNIAQWYYWAPKMNGGSRSKAARCFERAVDAARNDAERFFALSFLSQWLFESGDKEGSSAALDAGEAICPGSKRLRQMRQANENGMSIFEWDKKRSKMSSKT